MSDTPDTLYRLSTRLIEALDQQSKLNDEIKALNARLLELAPEKTWIVALSPTLFRVIDTRLDDVQVGDSLDVLFPEPISTGPVTPPAEEPAKRTRKAKAEQPAAPAPAATPAPRADLAQPPQGDLTVEEVVARFKSAIEASHLSGTDYAQKHRLPYLGLMRLLATGLVGDAAIYAQLYDHAVRLTANPVLAAPAAAAAPPPSVETKPAAGPSEPTPKAEEITDAVLRDLCRQAAAKVGPVRVREIMGAQKVEGVPAERRPQVATGLRQLVATGLRQLVGV